MTGAALSLPLKQADLINATLDLYRDWISHIAMPPAFERDPHACLPDILLHLSSVFTDHEYFTLEQRKICARTVLILERVPSWCLDARAASKTIDTMLRVMVGICDFLLHERDAYDPSAHLI